MQLKSERLKRKKENQESKPEQNHRSDEEQQEEAEGPQQQAEQQDQNQTQRWEEENWKWNWWPKEGKRKKKKNPKRKRGGTKKHRRLIGPIRNRRDPQVVSFFFGNITYASEKAKSYIIERNDDVILLAEHHKNIAGTIQLVNQFSRHNWRVTASPARPTERSAEGNTGGVLVGIKNFLDSRPPSFATDAEGKITSNAQLTGRMMVLSWLELLVLAGYLESGLGFTGSNYEFVVELEFLTRGGKVPFILAMDANEEPEAWDNFGGERKSS